MTDPCNRNASSASGVCAQDLSASPHVLPITRAAAARRLSQVNEIAGNNSRPPDRGGAAFMAYVPGLTRTQRGVATTLLARCSTASGQEPCVCSESETSKARTTSNNLVLRSPWRATAGIGARIEFECARLRRLGVFRSPRECRLACLRVRTCSIRDPVLCPDEILPSHEAHPRRVPLARVLRGIHRRSGLRLTISGTSHFGEGRARGCALYPPLVAVDMECIRLNPLVDRPARKDPTPWHRTGLWNADPQHPHHPLILSRLYARAYA